MVEVESCSLCPAEGATLREGLEAWGALCDGCIDHAQREKDDADAAYKAEREDLPYDVMVSLGSLSHAIDKMVERWQHRGWCTGAVSDKIRAELEHLKECL